MIVLNYLSASIIPVMIVFIILSGMSEKKDVFDLFCKGATDGLSVVFKLFPTLLRIVFIN